MALYKGQRVFRLFTFKNYFCNMIFILLNVQNRENEAISVLSKIYDLDRLEDEVALITAQSEQDRQKRDEARFKDVFKSKEIRLAFLAGAGLQVKVNIKIPFSCWDNLCKCSLLDWHKPFVNIQYNGGASMLNV